MHYSIIMAAVGGSAYAGTFEETKSFCSQSGKRLPTPETKTQMLSQGNGGIYWTGWTWSASENKYVNSYTGQPVSPQFEAEFLRGKDKSEFPNSALAIGFGTDILILTRQFDMMDAPVCVNTVSTRTLPTPAPVAPFLQLSSVAPAPSVDDAFRETFLNLFSDDSGEKTTEVEIGQNDVIARTGFEAEQTSVPTCVFDTGLSTEEVSLFSTTCEMDKFVIRLNDRCRRQKYSFIDFEHDTFVWGDASVKWDPTQPDRSGNTNWLSESKYQGMPIPECPELEKSNELNWNVEYTSCAIDTVAQPGKVQYSLYLNSFSPDGFVQVNQVAFRCSFENRYNVTSEVVSISNDQGMFDNVEQKDEIDFADYLSLNVYTASGNEWSPTGNMAYQLGTDLGGLTYNQLGNGQTVRLGDHVQLKIELKDGIDMDDFYDFSLYKCWAEVNGAGQELNLWDDYCPKYNWVGPDRSESVFNGMGAYLNTYWNNEVDTELRVVGLRQFAFAAPNGIENTLTYHCTVKICLDGDQSCSTTDPVGEPISVCSLNEDAEHSSTRVNRSTADREVEVSKMVRVSMEPRTTCIKRDGLCLSKKAFTEEELILLMEPDHALAHAVSLLLALTLLFL